MAGALAPFGIRVNVVMSGFINTRINSHVLADPGLLAEAEQLIPMHRVGQPTEVAGIIAWLTSHDPSYATGGYFMNNGGQICL
jgi:glucose 1-dehydrogenase